MEDIKITEGIQLADQERAAYDIQIATAKQWPRDIKIATARALTTATLDENIAESCGYAVPRAGKEISGPSVHLARIIVQNWGNVRVELKVVEITKTQVVSNAVCFDLETNYAVKVEVRKSIVGKYGRFSEDMITVTGNAANAIAFRNAVYSVVPKAVTDKIYNATRDMLTGDLTSEDKLKESRDNAIAYFKDKYNATEAEILAALGLKSLNQIKQDHIITLRSLKQGLKDGDTTPDEAFGRNKPEPKTAEELVEEAKAKKEALKNKQGTGSGGKLNMV